jgi:hypothetical protein
MPKLKESHIETQNHAGWVDGALGALEADEGGHFGSFSTSHSFISSPPNQAVAGKNAPIPRKMGCPIAVIDPSLRRKGT